MTHSSVWNTVSGMAGRVPNSAGGMCFSRDLVAEGCSSTVLNCLANLAKKRRSQRALLALWGKPGAK